MAAELIGRCTCPVCKGRARLTLARTQLPVITCNGCNFQGFARSDRSDALLRALVVPGDDAAPEPVRTEPPPPPKPAPVRTPEPVQQPAPEPAMAWGAFPFLR